jgi:hypothetical protein
MLVFSISLKNSETPKAHISRLHLQIEPDSAAN